MNSGGLIIFVLVAGFFLLGTIYNWYRDKKRTEAWARIAPTLGFAFAERDTGLPSQFSALPLFQEGLDRKAINVCQGTHGGISVWIFDYRFDTGDGKNKNIHRHTVCVAAREGLSLPASQLRPRGFLDRLGRFLGRQELEFPEDAEFAARYIVNGTEDEPIKAIFSLPVRQLLLNWVEEDIHLETAGERLLIYGKAEVPPEKSQELLAKAFALLKLWA